MKPIRLRDFIEDRDGCLYAVAAYDNDERVGGVLRYVPDPGGERIDPDGRHFRKLDFEPAFEWIRTHKPAYLDTLHRVPHTDIARVYKPEEEVGTVANRHPLVRRLLSTFSLPEGSVGCTGSLLCGLETASSDIDLVVYGDAFHTARRRLEEGVAAGLVDPLSPGMWHRVYEKRIPEIDFETFVLHESRKWNRGEIGGTYFDLLYTRPYGRLNALPVGSGEPEGRATVEAVVTDADLAFDNPAVFELDHPDIRRILSFSHTYSGQARTGETVEARGVLERHPDGLWLVVGTTREARGEYIVSKTLLDAAG